jgi:hypothetical protein
MAARLTRSKRVRVESGQKAIAPRVNHPIGFAIENDSGQALSVSFEYDDATHIQVVVVEPVRSGRRAPGEERTPFPA